MTLPAAARDGCGAPFSDALFTSTSAVCVTGLVVRDTATCWSGFGQAVILLLIQIGGLGVVSVATIITIVGNDVPVQIAEYARVSGTTKIVVGQSGAKRRHFWSKAPLTEQIIMNAPDAPAFIQTHVGIGYRMLKVE